MRYFCPRCAAELPGPSTAFNRMCITCWRKDPTYTVKNRQEFTEKIRAAINYCSIDSEMNMPDFVLADMLVGFLYSVLKANVENEAWRKSNPAISFAWDEIDTPSPGSGTTGSSSEGS